MCQVGSSSLVLTLQVFHLPDHGGLHNRLCVRAQMSPHTALAILCMYVRYKSDASTLLMKRTRVRYVLYTYVLLSLAHGRNGE